MNTSSQRLALSLHRADGESFPGLVSRLAEHNECSVGALLERVVPGAPHRLVPVALMSASELAYAAATIGIEQGEIAMSLLSRHGRSIPVLATSPSSGIERLAAEKLVDRREWVLIKRTRLCPECLTDDGHGIGGVFRLEWRFALAAVCMRHRAYLHDRCPECGGELGRNQRVALQTATATPTLCGRVLQQGRYAPACDRVLADLPRIAVTSDRLLSAQSLVFEGLETAAAQHPRPPSLFEEVRRCASLLLTQPTLVRLGELDPFAAEAFAKHLSRLPVRPSSTLRLRPVAPLVAAVLPTAVDLATADPEQLPEMLARTLGSAVSDAVSWNSVRGSSRLVTAGEQAVLLIQRNRRLARPRSARSAPLSSLNITHVPQLFWRHEYDEHLRQFQNGRQSNPFRRFCSLMLARELSGMSLLQIGQLLVLPHPEKTVGYSQARLNREKRLPDYLAALVTATEAATQRFDAPINYFARRQTLSSLILVPPELARLPTTGERALAAAWLWAELSEGDLSLSPAATHHAEFFSRPRVATTLHAATKTQAFQQLVPQLRSYGERLLLHELPRSNTTGEELTEVLNAALVSATVTSSARPLRRRAFPEDGSTGPGDDTSAEARRCGGALGSRRA